MPVQNRLKEILDERGLSQYRLVRDTGLSEPTVQELYRDPERVPTKKVLEMLCDYFDLEPGDLLKRVPPAKTGKGSKTEGKAKG